MVIVLFSLLSSAFYYLGSRAKITSALWSHYPPRFAAFMECSACTGFWWGLACAIVGSHTDATYLSMPLANPFTWPLVGLCSIVMTPITAGLMQRGLDQLGVATIEPTQEVDPEWKKLD